MTSTPAPSSLVILGGGTAGRMTANLLQKRWGASGTRFDLAEVTRFVSGCAMKHPSHAEALAAFHTQRAA